MSPTSLSLCSQINVDYGAGVIASIEIVIV